MHYSALTFAVLVSCMLIMNASSCVICSKPSCSCAAVTAPLNPKMEFYKKYPMILRLKTKLYNKLHNELKDVVCLDCATGNSCGKCPSPPLYCTPVPPLAAKKELFNNAIIKETQAIAPCVGHPAPAPAYISAPAITGSTVVKQVPNSSEEEAMGFDASNVWQLLQGSNYMPHIETTKSVCGF